MPKRRYGEVTAAELKSFCMSCKRRRTCEAVCKKLFQHLRRLARGVDFVGRGVRYYARHRERLTDKWLSGHPETEVVVMRPAVWNRTSGRRIAAVFEERARESADSRRPRVPQLVFQGNMDQVRLDEQGGHVMGDEAKGQYESEWEEE